MLIKKRNGYFSVSLFCFMVYNVEKKRDEIMHIIVCVDDNNGIMFNNRRVSFDKKVTQRIIEITQHKRLWVSHYTLKLFEKASLKNTNLIVSNSFFSKSKANKNDYVFVEDILPESLEDCEEVIIFRWNRKYPSDVKFDFDLSDSFELVSSKKIKGFSHIEVTEEHFAKKSEK